MFNLTKDEGEVFKKLHSPVLIQDFINKLEKNDSETCMSPRKVLDENKAHCLEGALLASAILWYHGHKPILLDIKSKAKDFDHVVTLFKVGKYWGAISKTSHAVLRYREPVYKNIRELAMSYFHEYFTDDGDKTMLSYSKPFDLKKYGTMWITSEENLWDIGGDLDDSPHYSVVPKNLKLRKADKIEIKIGKIIN